MDTINLSRKASGGYLRAINGASPRLCSGFKYDTNGEGVKLFTDANTPLTIDFLLPAAWTIGGVTGFATVEAVCDALDKLVVHPGIIRGRKAVVPHDVNELPLIGWIKPTTLAGNIAYITEAGDEVTEAFELNQISDVRARKVLATDTTATGIILLHE